MIDKNEEKILKRTYIYASVSWIFLIVIVLGGLYLAFLSMIENSFFLLDHDSSFTVGIYAYLLIALIYVIVFIYMICYLINIYRNSSLDNIYEGESFVSLADLLKKEKKERKKRNNRIQIDTGLMKNKVREVMYDHNIKLPKIKFYVFAIIALPIIILSSIYVVHFIDCKIQMSKYLNTARENLQIIENALQEGCDNVYSFDMDSDYQSFGYSISGYLYDGQYQSYISIYLNNEGTIDTISYCKDIDISLSKEENIDSTNSDFQTLHNLIADIDVSIKSKYLLSEPELNNGFVEDFKNGSYYEESSFYRSNYSLSYYTYQEDEMNEYNIPYIYLSYTYY